MFEQLVRGHAWELTRLPTEHVRDQTRSLVRRQIEDELTTHVFMPICDLVSEARDLVEEAVNVQ